MTADTDEIAARLGDALEDCKGFSRVMIPPGYLRALLDERERQIEHIAKQAQDIMTLSAELARLREPVGEVGEMAKRLSDGVCDDKCKIMNISGGCDCAIAADLLTRQAAENADLTGKLEVAMSIVRGAKAAHDAERQHRASLREAVEVMRLIADEENWQADHARAFLDKMEKPHDR
jgi:pyocin large subunit-like protein